MPWSVLCGLASCESGEAGEVGERVVEGDLGRAENAMESVYRSGLAETGLVVRFGSTPYIGIHGFTLRLEATDSRGDNDSLIMSKHRSDPVGTRPKPMRGMNLLDILNLPKIKNQKSSRRRGW